MDKYYIVQDECIGCGICAGLCTQEAVFSLGDIYVIRDDKCNGCGECECACPVCCIKRSFVFDPDPIPSFFDIEFFHELALAWLHTPWDETWSESGIDCSDLVWNVLCEMGLYYPYANSWQLPSSDFFELILESQLQPGDLLVWQWHHVAIYCYGAVPAGFDGSCDIWGSTATYGAIYCHSTYWREHFGAPICLRYHPR